MNQPLLMTVDQAAEELSLPRSRTQRLMAIRPTSAHPGAIS